MKNSHKLKINIFRGFAITALFFFCQSFQCEEVYYTEIYFGGIVKDSESKQPIPEIEIWVNEASQVAVTDKVGKFGFKEEKNTDKYEIHFRDRRENKIYADKDTLVNTIHQKVLMEILLQKIY